tara:strand:+ start:442 stop:1191 length:750 start_codon:yes stop_codon:yes gene_type:complete
MTSKFNYLVSFYFGPRGNENYNARLKDNKFFFAEKHIEFLENYSQNNIDKVIFVVNLTPNDNQEEITNFFAENSSKISDDIEVNLIFRDNYGFSYAAWNEGIIDDLQNEDGEAKYYMCLEEDYMLKTDTSVLPMIERCNEVTSYVASFAVIDHPNYSDHPSFSTGMFYKDSCRKVYEEKENPFYIINGSNNYPHAWKIQQTFYKNFLDTGHKITDFLDEYSCDFLCTGSNELKTFGESNTERLIVPVMP